MYYRGYLLVRLKTIGREWDLTNKLKGMKSKEPDEDWKITYATPVYGGWDVIVECCFRDLKDLDRVVSYCRADKDIGNWIEETTTLMGLHNDYPS